MQIYEKTIGELRIEIARLQEKIDIYERTVMDLRDHIAQLEAKIDIMKARMARWPLVRRRWRRSANSQVYWFRPLAPVPVCPGQGPFLIPASRANPLAVPESFALEQSDWRQQRRVNKHGPDLRFLGQRHLGRQRDNRLCRYPRAGRARRHSREQMRVHPAIWGPSRPYIRICTLGASRFWVSRATNLVARNRVTNRTLASSARSNTA